MELINMQSLTLLTTIIAVVSNILSINENVSKNGLVNIFKTMSYYILPIILLKPIIVAVYELKTTITLLISIIPVSIFFIIKKKGIRFFCKDENSFISGAFILSLLLILQIFMPYYPIEDYVNRINTYIYEIENYKVSIELYQYMASHLFCTLCLLIDVVEMVLFLIISFKELFYYKKYIFNNKNDSIKFDLDVSINFNKMVYNFLVLIIIMTFGKHIISYLISLF